VVDVGDLDGLVRRGSGCRCRSTVVTRNHRENEGNALRIGFVVPLAPTALGLLALRPAVLVPGALWSIDVVGVHLLVLLLLLLRQLLPILPFLCREALPLLADRLGKICLTLLLRRSISGRCLLLSLLTVLATFTTEEDEGVFGSLDIVLVALFRPSLEVTAA
jgi:hypothetical protein